jgi:hypothetical protein
MKDLKTKDFNFCPFWEHEAKVKPFLFKRSFSIFKSTDLTNCQKKLNYYIFSYEKEQVGTHFMNVSQNAICL